MRNIDCRQKLCFIQCLGSLPFSLDLSARNMRIFGLGWSTLPVCIHLYPSMFFLYSFFLTSFSLFVLHISGQAYLVLPHSMFCECQAYRFTVLKGDALMCKHVLAARIAEKLGAQNERAISNKDFQVIDKLLLLYRFFDLKPKTDTKNSGTLMCTTLLPTPNDGRRSISPVSCQGHALLCNVC